MLHFNLKMTSFDPMQESGRSHIFTTISISIKWLMLPTGDEVNICVNINFGVHLTNENLVIVLVK